MKKKFLYAMVAICLVSSIALGAYAKPVRDEERRGGLFHSYISIEISDEDIQKLSKPLPLYAATPVQVRIKYWHDIPIKLGMFLRMLIFHTFVPQQTIHLEIESKPDWATIYFSEPDVIIDVPDKGEKAEKNVTLVISPLREAPSEPTDITIVASCGKLGMLGGTVYRYTISFTPNFLASIAVEAPAKIDVSPHETKEVTIKVKNICNRNVLVSAEPVGEAKSRWGASVQPSFKEIPAGQTETFKFSIIGPYEFGWHEEISTLTVKLSVRPQPELTSEHIEPQEFYVDFTVQNVGFYMPVPLLVAIVIILVAVCIAVYYVIRVRTGS